MREWRDLRNLAAYAAGVAAVGLVLALIGPFGTFSELTPVQRLGYWLSIVAVNTIQVHVGVVVATRLLPAPKWPTVVPVVLAGVVAAVPATFEVQLLEAFYRPGRLSSAGFAELYPLVLLVTLAVSAVVVLYLRVKAPTLIPGIAGAAEAGAGGPTLGRFAERIPAHLGDGLLCLKTEDHYLRVYTERGDDLVLFRMRDAEAELAGADGLRVHRSYWVTRRAVTRIKRHGSKATLVLSNDLAVPVSRSCLPRLRDAGWM